MLWLAEAVVTVEANGRESPRNISEERKFKAMGAMLEFPRRSRSQRVANHLLYAFHAIFPLTSPDFFGQNHYAITWSLNMYIP